MKKNLTFLTGIVLLITILVAGSCGNGTKQNGSINVADDSTKVDIFLKEILIDGSMHLLMYDSKKPDCEVIDNLVTVVYPGYTVTWKKAQHSEIKDVLDIRPIDDDGNIFGKGVIKIEIKGKSLWTLVIPDSATTDTVKYEIVFTVKKDTITIDPYLKIPRH